MATLNMTMRVLSGKQSFEFDLSVLYVKNDPTIHHFLLFKHGKSLISAVM